VTESNKVKPAHLRRQAWVYVRQSTMTQVRENTESLNRQYELVDRANVLGWSRDQVHVVDEDLGRSGADATARTGFQALVAAIGLGSVGLVLGIEVSRLARSNADWYHLLDLCSLTDTLIADSDGLYHPAEYNDRLILGLKGTMSEAELHVLRSRLDAGLRHKAARGDLKQGLPVGYDYDEDDRVVLNPNEAVREAIATVLTRFEKLGSARQVVLSLRADGLLLPRRTAGSRTIRWAEATYPAVHDFITNPTYGGAFVFGRTKTVKRVDESGRIVTRVCELPRDEWEILLPDHHPGYVSWETYLSNQDKLTANARPPKGDRGGAVREGSALLQGLVVCGKCGRRMLVGYSGPKGRNHRYVCAQGQRLYGQASNCQSISGPVLDAAVVQEVFAVLQPAALAATAKALSEVESEHTRRLRVFELSVERAHIDAERARRQFDAVEPENRLVARSLEKKWEARLATQRQAENDLAAQKARRPATLTADEVHWLSQAGADLRGVFDAPTTTLRERKQLLRLLIPEIVITADGETRQGTGHVLWEGGARTTIAVTLPRKSDGAIRTEADVVDRVRRLAEHYDDATIARMLARLGIATATGLPFTRDRVGSLRRSYGIPAPPEAAESTTDQAEVVSVAEAEKLLGTSRATLYRWLAGGFITGEQRGGPSGPWRIRVDHELRAKIAPEVPTGWVGLDEAARRLGVARQTVLDRVQRGELNAVHVNRGQRKGLAIDITPAANALFPAS
jgi:DNA invertase Pin-like site-specific DNA recombinase